MSLSFARRSISRNLTQRSFHTTAINMTKFDIEVVSDTVCPWCYVGKQKLDKAIKVFKERNPDSNDEFSITWKPFYLNPGSPNKGMYTHSSDSTPHILNCSYYLLYSPLSPFQCSSVKRTNISIKELTKMTSTFPNSVQNAPK